MKEFEKKVYHTIKDGNKFNHKVTREYLKRKLHKPNGNEIDTALRNLMKIKIVYFTKTKRNSREFKVRDYFIRISEVINVKR